MAGSIWPGRSNGGGFLLFTPIPLATLNNLIGGALILVAIASVTYMIVGVSGPNERGPNF